MEYTPFKCPDCKVWWRGETHKCDTPVVTVSVNPPATVEKDKGQIRIESNWNRHDKCFVCKKQLSKSDVVMQYTRCAICREKRNKGYGRHGYNSPNWDA